MTVEELKDLGYEDVVVFENPSYGNCIIGVSTDNKCIYSLSKMVEWYSKKNDCDESEALEFIKYNTIRSLPYFSNSPVILNDMNL